MSFPKKLISRREKGDHKRVFKSEKSYLLLLICELFYGIYILQMSSINLEFSKKNKIGTRGDKEAERKYNVERWMRYGHGWLGRL